MDDRQLQRYIINTSGEERRELLQDENIRNKFLEDKNHYPFVWLVELLGDDLKYFLDENYMKKILKTPRVYDKLNIIMACNNKYADSLLMQDEVLEFLLSSYGEGGRFRDANYEIGQAIIDYDIRHKSHHEINLGKFSKQAQLKIFNNEYILKLLENNLVTPDLLCSVDVSILSKLLNYNEVQRKFLDMRINDINYLILKRNLKLPNNLQNNYQLIKKYIKLPTNKYREYVNNLQINNQELYFVVEQNRKNYVEYQLNNSGNILKKYQNYHNIDLIDLFQIFDFRVANKLLEYVETNQEDKINELLKDLTTKETYEMIIDTLFKDIPYNFLANLKIVLDYYLKNKPNIKIDKYLYNQIINYDKLSIEGRKKLFNDYKDKDCALDFYELFRGIKNDSYDDIHNHLFQFDKYYNEDLSKKLGCDTYYLNGEPFNLCIHTTRYNPDEKELSRIWRDNQKTISLSIIGDQNINYYNDRTNNIMFGFKNLKKDHIMHISKSDSFTSGEDGTNKIHSIYNIHDLLDNTIGYNEILYSEHNLDNFKPDFLVAYDAVNELEKTVADYFNLPIVIINSDKYISKCGIENISQNCYLTAVGANKLEGYDKFEKDFNTHQK